MATGFIYIITSVNRNYEQKQFCKVPTFLEKRLFFGTCKVAMRRKMMHGDYVFGISHSMKHKPRRVVFATKIAECIRFAEAYRRFPKLRGSDKDSGGPIHVQPISMPGLPFPQCDYEHIPGATHDNRWVKDLATRDLYRFFVGELQDGWFGRWLGQKGPEIDQDIMRVLKTCSVYNKVGSELSRQNHDATQENPIAYRCLNRGLHLETSEPEALIELLNGRMAGIPLDSGIGNVEADITKPGRNKRSSCKSSC